MKPVFRHVVDFEDLLSTTGLDGEDISQGDVPKSAGEADTQPWSPQEWLPGDIRGQNLCPPGGTATS